MSRFFFFLPCADYQPQLLAQFASTAKYGLIYLILCLEAKARSHEAYSCRSRRVMNRTHYENTVSGLRAKKRLPRLCRRVQDPKKVLSALATHITLPILSKAELRALCQLPPFWATIAIICGPCLTSFYSHYSHQPSLQFPHIKTSAVLNENYSARKAHKIRCALSDSQFYQSQGRFTSHHMLFLPPGGGELVQTQNEKEATIQRSM